MPARVVLRGRADYRGSGVRPPWYARPATPAESARPLTQRVREGAYYTNGTHLAEVVRTIPLGGVLLRNSEKGNEFIVGIDAFRRSWWLVRDSVNAPRPHDSRCVPYPRAPDSTDSYIGEPSCPPGHLLKDHGRGLIVTRMSFLDLFVRRVKDVAA
jgi:hypothetical protein